MLARSVPLSTPKAGSLQNADRRPATDPHLQPGQVTAWLRVEDQGVSRIDEPGPFEQFVIHLRLSNQQPRPVHFASGPAQVIRNL
ncbi:hypothetical protein GCM10017788_33280 [Amycolatopsis acidiphila]|nr:hypothetical protein GCM10017788_33280 [Amycolatopsis acidiphila]